MTKPALRLVPLLGALALPLSAQTVTTVLNDTFADNERATQSLPASAKWLTSASSGTLDASSGALVAANGNTTLAHFAGSGSPVELAVGESLTLTFNLSLSAITNAAANFRVGFYNSGGAQLSADNFGNANAAFTGGYAGYIAAVNVGATANNMFRAYERGSSTALIGTSISNFTQTGSSVGGAFKTFSANTVYLATITLSRTAESSLSVTQSYTGVFSGDSVSTTASGTVSDASGLTTSFDTLALFYNNTAALNFDNIKLDYSSLSSVPEPASASALAGAFALSAVALRRRRRA